MVITRTGMEQWKALELKNLDVLDRSDVILDYIDAQKRNFGIKICPGKCFYILIE